MGDVYRERIYRERDEYDDEGGEYKHTTIRRYKVKPSRDDRPDAEDDRRSRYSSYAGRDLEIVEPDRRSERPRSVYDGPDDRDYDRPRSVYHDRDDREPKREPRPTYRDDARGIMVYEGDEPELDRRSHYGRADEEIKVERRYEDRYEDSHGHDVDRIRKETEYYRPAEPQPPPVIIAPRAPEPQKIVVQEQPPPPPVIVPLPRQEPGVVVLRDRERDSPREMQRRDPRDYRDDDYYYDRREVGPYRGPRDREQDWAMARYDRRREPYSDDEDDHRHHHHRRHVRRYHHREEVRSRSRSSSEDSHHKRHLAAGALAGAGVTALLSSRMDSKGDLPEHRGRKVVAGGALGALGTEALKRAHSAYADRRGEGRDSDDRHSMLKKGLGVAAVALAAAGAAKYYQANKVDKEERRRGRSKTRRGGRHSDSDDYSRSRSGSVRSTRSTKSRRRSISTAAKAAIGTAAAAGVVNHFRERSKSRNGSRSKSRIRKVAEMGGAAAAAGVATKLWKNRQEKKEDKERALEESDHSRSRSRRSRRRSPDRRSRSRSMARSFDGDYPSDRELGMVEYGKDPLDPGPRGDAAGYESAAEERRRRRRRDRDRDRNQSSDEDSNIDRKRSKSRLRDMAAAGAAAFGIKEYQDRKNQEKKEKRSRERRSRERRSRDRSRGGDRGRDDRSDDGYFDRPARTYSPPMASGGAYMPPYPSTPGAEASAGGYAQYPPGPGAYMPQDYTGFLPPPPAGGPPPPGPPGPPGPPPNAGSGFPPPPPGPPGPPRAGNAPDHVSPQALSQPPATGKEDDGVKDDYFSSSHLLPPPLPSKSVSFIPLSPQSSRTMERHHKEHAETEARQAAEEVARRRSMREAPEDEDGVSPDEQRDESRSLGLRRGSDPSWDRPLVARRRHDRGYDDDNDDEVEDLPNRFDAYGRPLDRRSSSHGAWSTRNGQFERRAHRPGDFDVRGAWQIGGTDPEVLERMVRGVTGALEGRKGWMGLIGDVLGSGLLEGGHKQQLDDADDVRMRRRGQR